MPTSNLLEAKNLSRERYIDARYADTLSNIHYAPGFATYGLRGYSGQSGIDSPFIYISDIDFDEKNPATLYEKIKDNEPLSVFDASVIDTDKDGTYFIQYKQGDIVITPDGSVYRIVEKLSDNNDNTGNVILDKYNLILSKLYQIENDSFISADIDNVKSLVVSDTDNVTGTAPLTVSGKDSTRQKPLVNIRSTTGNIPRDLKIYFDSSKSGWVIESDSPIYFDTEGLKIKAEDIRTSVTETGYTGLNRLIDYSVRDVYDFLTFYLNFGTSGVSIIGGVGIADDEPILLDIDCLQPLDMVSMSVKDEDGYIVEKNAVDLSGLYTALNLSRAEGLTKGDLTPFFDELVSDVPVIRYNFYYNGLKFVIPAKD